MFYSEVQSGILTACKGLLPMPSPDLRQNHLRPTFLPSERNTIKKQVESEIIQPIPFILCMIRGHVAVAVQLE